MSKPVHLNRPVALAPGVRVGPYEIISQLGAGGMGEVYRARDTRLERAVAIKVLPDAVTASTETLERLQGKRERPRRSTTRTSARSMTLAAIRRSSRWSCSTASRCSRRQAKAEYAKRQ
jgi:serine/threonine protein kinase